METHTLTERQARDLSRTLGTHISQGMPVGNPGKSRLVKLQRITPNQGQKWAVISLREDEEEIFQALVNSHWGRKKEALGEEKTVSN